MGEDGYLYLCGDPLCPTNKMLADAISMYIFCRDFGDHQKRTQVNRVTLNCNRGQELEPIGGLHECHSGTVGQVITNSSRLPSCAQ